MKYTVTLSPQPDNDGEVFLVAAWRKGIGEMVTAGETLAVLRPPDSAYGVEIPIVSPAFGILARKCVLPGEAIEVGEPLAILAGVPESLLSGTEGMPSAFAARPPYIPSGPEEIAYLSAMQRAVAEHMARSAQASPHVYTVAMADVEEAQRLAARLETDLLPFVAAAVASALTRHPTLNAERADDGAAIRCKRYIHLGLARTTDGGNLKVFVLRDADRKSVRALAQETTEMRRDSHSGHGGGGTTFTLWADPMPPGIRFQTPVLHQPQAAILRLGAVERSPVVAEDGQTLVAQSLLPLCLAHDARVVRDTEAAAFLADVKTELEEARFLFSG